MEMNYPTTDEYDQDIAKGLLEHCATLIVDKFPPGCEFGIDLSVHFTANKFLGIKLIPPGVHFVYFSHVKGSNTSPRIGFFKNFTPRQVVCLCWSEQDEDLRESSVEETEKFGLAFEKHELDSLLGAYQYSKYQTWMSLSDFITPQVMKQCDPQCGKLFSATQLVYESEECRRMRKLDAQGLPDMVVSPECRLRFAANIPQRFLIPDSASSNQISEHSMDSSFTLDSVIRDCFATEDARFVGELQYAFVAFTLGQVFEAFEHWRDMVRIVCNAKKALLTRTEFYLDFIRVCHFQLRQAEEALFADIVENENILYLYLQCFFVNLHNIPEQAQQEHSTVRRLIERGQRFQQTLRKTLKWQFQEEPDDELPVVVET